MKKMLLACLSMCALWVNAQQIDTAYFKAKGDDITTYLRSTMGSYRTMNKVGLDSLRLDSKNSTIKLYYNRFLAHYPLRNDSRDQIYKIVSQDPPSELKSYKIQILSEGRELDRLIPSYYKKGQKVNKAAKPKNKPVPLVTPLDSKFTASLGLQGRHIALWQSHGFYYEQKLLRWEWQRARIFQTVEDLYTQSYVLPFVVPMLENAGAVVLLPRERDSQINEVIVDNDHTEDRYSEQNGKNAWTSGQGSGFANPKDYYVDGENPFKMGTYRQVSTSKSSESTASWTPNIPEKGQYTVSISYQSLPNSADDVLYTVYHKGGKSSFKVNQTMGGGTWIYLGTFDFDKGRGQKVVLSNISKKEGRIISADAVKIGGGMGNIARTISAEGALENAKSSSNEAPKTVKATFVPEPQVSRYPRFTEGARYFLQWAGFPDSVYTAYKGKNDYNDDYVSRGQWVNYLLGGTKANPDQKGLGIPVDMSFAFHTDAGTTLNDDIVGTLSIFTTTENNKDTYPDGTSRYSSRDLSDLMQTQIVEDVRALHEPQWTRRQLMNGNYSESRSPKVPSTLLELLSHQNLSDMRLGLDPRFRFTVSRAIYKGILKYLNQKNGTPYIVQPLPVDTFSAELIGSNVVLKWRSVTDSLEVTARPDAYIVYTRVGREGAFDNGVLVEKNSYTAAIDQGEIYSFKIAAVNKGGKSFDSEILSVYQALQGKGKVLIVNGFERLSAPYSFASSDAAFGGFMDSKDHGVPYLKDISYIGSQHEFRRNIPWMDDDSAGFGASDSDYETKVIVGNTFDYPFAHGKAMADLGYSFVSTSSKAVEAGIVDINNYKIVDLILGKQRQTISGHNTSKIEFEAFSNKMRQLIADYTSKGGNILVSGAFVATDLWDSYKVDKHGKDFAQKVLKFRWMTDSSSSAGEVYSAPSPFGIEGDYSFYTKPNDVVYCVESPDGLVPVGENAYTVFRYKDNNISAGVAYRGDDYRTVILGFPIETVKGEQNQAKLIESVLDFLSK